MTYMPRIFVIGLVLATAAGVGGADHRLLSGTAPLVSKGDLSSPAAYEKSMQANRARFKKYEGVSQRVL